MKHQDVKKKFEKLEKFLKPFYENNEQPNKIERELIKAYMLELYESLMPWMNDAPTNSIEVTGSTKEIPTSLKIEREVSVVKGYVGGGQISNETSTQSTIAVENPVKIQEQEKVVIEQPKPVEVPVVQQPTPAVELPKPIEQTVIEQPVVEPIIVEAKVVEPVVEEPKVAEVVVEKVVEVTHNTGQAVETTKYSELFQINLGKDISERLANLPLKSLKGAIGINDKILLVNELFKGDMGKYNDLIDKLDRLSTFGEAREFLSNEIVPIYNWDDEAKLERAKTFVQLINRRYLN